MHFLGLFMIIITRSFQFRLEKKRMENKIKSLPAHLEEQHTACCITCLWRRVAKHLTSTEEADNAYSAKNEVIHHSRATSSTFLSQISYNSSVTNAKGGGGSLWAFCVVWVLRAPSHHFACPEEKKIAHLSTFRMQPSLLLMNFMSEVPG